MYLAPCYSTNGRQALIGRELHTRFVRLHIMGNECSESMIAAYTAESY